MVISNKLIFAPALVLASVLLLAGCSTTGEEPTPAPASSTPADGDNGTGNPEPGFGSVPDGKLSENAVVEGRIPTGGAPVLSSAPSDDGTAVVYTFTGDKTNISALKEIFEHEGYKWNDVKGDGSSIFASAENSNLAIDDRGDGTYTYTVFQGE